MGCATKFVAQPRGFKTVQMFHQGRFSRVASKTVTRPVTSVYLAVSVTVDALLTELTSTELVVAMPVLAIVPVTFAFALMVIVAVEPAASEFSVQFTVPPPLLVGRVQVPTLVVSVLNRSDVGRISLKVTACAAPVPILATANVYVTVSPLRGVAVLTLPVTRRSTLDTDGGVGVVGLLTVTVKLPLAVLPAVSEAEQLTVVVPMLNVDEESGEQLTGRTPETASDAEAE